MKSTIRVTLAITAVLSGLHFAQTTPAQEFLPEYDRAGKVDRLPVAASDGRTITLEDCNVQAFAEPILAAAESGRLLMVPQPGDIVEAGQVIAQTDDTIAQHQQRVAYFGFLAEKTKLESDIELRYARKNAQVREASYRDAKDANDRIKNAVSPNMLRMRLFEWEGAKLSIEKTLNDQKITRAGAEVKLAEFDLSKAMVDRHQIESPANGVIQERFKHVGEWVKPGDPIARLSQMDRLRVIGHLPLHHCSPAMLKGRIVTVDIPTRLGAEGQILESRTIESTVTHVGVEISDASDFEIWAEIENTEKLDFWPGMPGVRMILELPSE